MDYLSLQPVAAAIWMAVIVVSFVVVFNRILDNLRHIRAYRRELVVKARGLRIHRMLSRAGTTLSRYLRRARPMDVELDLLVCEHCETTDACDKYLDHGEDVEARTFCPNFDQLETHGRRSR